MSTDSNTRVSLGCGTLIVIALIVAVFSNGSDISNEIQRLRLDVQDLSKEVKDLRAIIEVRQAKNAERPDPQDL